MRIKNVGIVGGGAWGTALAQTLALAGHDITLWAYEPDTIQEINDHHINRIYLPGVTLEKSIRATGKLRDIADCDLMLLVPPAQHLRTVAQELSAHISTDFPTVVCAKGIERTTGSLMVDVLTEVLPQARPAVLSGPSFAADVARGLPAALTLACDDPDIGKMLAEGLGYQNLRIYWSDDVIGVQLGGALKNVLAIAAGIVSGKELGASAHAALVARGFAELRRLSEKMGARPDTIMGLSGLGDLILTCGSTQSRNMSLGRALGQGKSLEETLGSRHAVTEGVYTAEATMRLAQSHEIEMPICAAVHAIISGKVSVNDAITGLLSRPQRAEDES